MMRLKLTYLILLAGLMASAQPSMEDGFAMLENGEFSRAARFFDAYLETDPGNRTAQLCYGRAVGLTGNPIEARGIFSDLLEAYPGDLELQLNFNESLLWEGEYETALPLYEALLEEYPNRFEVVLGHANTLSNLKRYEAARRMIRRALQLDPGNPSALISRKYIWMGLASQKMSMQDYAGAERLVDSLMPAYPADAEVLKLAANLYQQTEKFEAARSCYRALAQPGDSLEAWSGIALTWQLEGRPGKALAFTRKAVAGLPDTLTTPRASQARERYVQSLIWNGRYNQAKRTLQEKQDGWVPEQTRSGLWAMWATYTSRFKESENQYRALLQADSASFDGNLGLANALMAQDRPGAAYRAGQQALAHFPGQRDAMAFAKKLEARYLPQAQTEAGYAFDNGDNESYHSRTSVRLPWHPNWEARVAVGIREAFNRSSGSEASTREASAGVGYRLAPHTALRAEIGGLQAESAVGNYFLPKYALSLEAQPLRMHQLTLGFERKLQNFNADLIVRQIRIQQYSASYHLATNFRMGLYSQVTHQRQSDANTSWQFFAALYGMPLKKPVLKLGVNFQELRYSEQLPEVYFSPELYRAADGFAEYRPSLGKNLLLVLSAASGYQWIDSQEGQMIFRGELSFNLKLSDRLQTGLFGKYNSQASATAAGFEYTQAGLRLNWQLAASPVFSMEQL